MKYLKLIIAIMLSTMTAFVSSCYQNSVPAIVMGDSISGASEGVNANAIKLGDVTYSTEYSYKIMTTANTGSDTLANIGVDIYVDGAKMGTLTSSSQVISGKGKQNSTITVKAKLSDANKKYVIDEFQKTVKLDYNGKVIVFDIPKLGTPHATAATRIKKDIKNNGVSNVSNAVSNRNLMYGSDAQVTATLALKSESAASLSDNDTITVAVQKATDMNTTMSTSGNEEVWFNVMTVKLGGTISKLPSAATLNINNKYIEKDMEFRCPELSDEVIKPTSNGNIDLSITQLKDYTIQCRAKLSDIIDSIPEKSADYLIVPYGNKPLTYTTKSGFSCQYDANEFITKFLTERFGKYTDSATQTITIANSQYNAKVLYTDIQQRYQYTVYFGNLMVDVFVYGKDEITVDTSTAVKTTETK